MLKKSWKKWMCLIITVSMALTIAACDVGSNANSQSSGPIKLRILWWGSQSRHDATLKVLDLYTKKNPNVTFIPEYSGWEGYWDKLATQSAAKNAPDIIQMDAQYLQEYAGRKQLADLSQGIKVDGVDKALLDTGKYNNGKLYAIPTGNNAFGMVYNKKALESLGVSLPRPDWTWDDLFKLAREIQPKLEKGKYALRDFSYDRGVYEMYQFSKGKGPINTPDGKFTIDKETWKEWEQIFAQLRKEGVVPPPDVTVSEKEYDPQQDLLLNGKVLIKQSFAAQFPSFDSVHPNTYALAKAPKALQAGGYLKPSMFWSVSADSRHIEEAKKFIDFFINDPEAAEILGVTRGIPVSKPILDKMQPKFKDNDKAQLDLIKVTALDANPFNGGPKGFGNWTKEYEKAGQAFIFGQISIDKYYEEIQKKWHEAIKSK